MGDILQNISIITAAFTAIYGIFAWKKEHIIKQKIDLAEDVLSKIYRIKDVIRFMRGPFSTEDEGKTRQKKENETKDEERAFNKAFVIFERYNNNKESFSDFNSLKYRYMAKFGKQCEKPFEIINQVTNEIFSSAHLLGTIYWQAEQKRYMQTDELEEHTKSRRKFESVFWETDKNDGINIKIDEAIVYCEEVCKKANSIKSLLNVFTA